MDLVLSLFAGAFIGSVLGFVGAGGAMLSVPILIYLFDFTPHHAATAALAIVFSAALSGALPKMKSRQILYRDAFIIWGIGSISNIALSQVSDKLSERFITTGFAVVLVIAGISMLRNPLTLIHKRIPLSLLILISLIIGSMTGVFGIGGGFLAIPVLVLFFGTPQNIAAGTSLLIISLNSITALIAHHRLWDEIDWHIPAGMTIAAVIVAMIASHKSSKVNSENLRTYFAFLLFAVALFTFIESWIA